MRLSWRERLEWNPSLADINTWPLIVHTKLAKHKQKKYLRNLKIVSKVLAGTPLSEVAKSIGVDQSLISYLMKRCLGGVDDEEPSLTAGLIPGTRINKGERHSPLSSVECERGNRGSFEKMLKTCPGMLDKLDLMLSAHVKRKSYGQNLTPKTFHTAILQHLRDNNWPLTRYPFDTQTLARESSRKYFRDRLIQLHTPVRKAKRVIVSKIPPKLAYQEVQIDSQLLDVTVSWDIEVNGVVTSHRLSRPTIFLAIDSATGCYLAYNICLTRHPNEGDLLQLLNDLHTKWVPLKLNNPSLAYEPGACLPTALGETFLHIGIGILRLDNALCHHSHRVRNYVCNEMGATLNHGLPAHPKGRAAVEYAFRLISEQTHRFPSTSGSHSQDPKKESKINSKSPPLLTLSDLQECMSVYITGHNVQPLERLSGKSPIEVLKSHVESFPIQLSFSNLYKNRNPFICQNPAVLRRNIKEHREPHVKFMKLRYTGDLNGHEKFINKKILIEYDYRDIRSIRVISLEGKSLGELRAPMTWQANRFSKGTRATASRMFERDKLLATDSWACYFELHLVNKGKSKYAAELARLCMEIASDQSTITIPIMDKGNVNTPKVQNTKKSFGEMLIPKWSPSQIHTDHKDAVQ